MPPLMFLCGQEDKVHRATGDRERPPRAVLQCVVLKQREDQTDRFEMTFSQGPHGIGYNHTKAPTR
jgi:hypothetical protein